MRLAKRANSFGHAHANHRKAFGAKLTTMATAASVGNVGIVPGRSGLTLHVFQDVVVEQRKGKAYVPIGASVHDALPYEAAAIGG